MKNIIVTGAGGMIAKDLIAQLQKNGDYSLFLISTSADSLKDKYKDNSSIQVFTLYEFEQYTLNSNEEFSILIHLAFARSADGANLANSLDYTAELLGIAKSINLKRFVNISSQGVYGNTFKPLWKESTPVAPNYMYALAKYSAELLVNTALEGGDIKYTNIRLSSVIEKVRFVSIFVKQAQNGEIIKVTTPSQKCSFIDPSDVVRAIITLIKQDDNKELQKCYNLGSNECYTILEVANIIKRIASDNFGIDVNIEVHDNEVNSEVGIDSSLFFNEFNWKPKVTLDDSITMLFND